MFSGSIRVLSLLLLSYTALASFHPSPLSDKMHIYRRQSSSSSSSSSSSHSTTAERGQTTVSSVSTIFVTTTPGQTASAVTTAAAGNTIVIVISTAAAPSATPSNTTLSPSAAASNGSLAAGAFNSSSTSSSSSSSPTPSPIFSTFTPLPSTSPSSSASALPQSNDDTIAGLSKGGFTGLVVGLVLAAILLLLAAYFGIKYIRGARERREWEAYQNLSGMQGPAYLGDASGAGYGEDEMSEVGRSPGTRDSVGMMMRVTGASELGAPGERGSVISERWQRNQY